jgi:hypothetical protein
MAQMTADMARRIIANWEATKKHYGITAWEECQLAHAFLAKKDQAFRAGMRAAAAMANEHMSRHVTSGVLELRDAILAEADK